MGCSGRVQTLQLIFVKQMGEGSGLKTRERNSKLLFSLHTGRLYDLISEIHIETDVAVSHLAGCLVIQTRITLQCPQSIRDRVP